MLEVHRQRLRKATRGGKQASPTAGPNLLAQGLRTSQEDCPALVKPSDGCSPSQHLGGNTLGDPKAEPPSKIVPEILTRRSFRVNCEAALLLSN